MPKETVNKTRISSEEVQHIADLARIEITGKEKEKFADELSAVLSYIDQLNEVDTKDVSVTNQVTGLANVVREDIAQNSSDDTKKKIIDTAPLKEDGYIKVKAVL